MNIKIKILMIVGALVVISMVAWLLSRGTPLKTGGISDTGQTDNPKVSLVFRYPSIEKTGFGIIDGSICYLDSDKNLKIYDGNTHKTIEKLSYESARIISNGKSCVVDTIDNKKFHSVLLTQELSIKQYQDLTTNPHTNSEYYQFCKDENCSLVDSKGTTIKNFPGTTLTSTPEVDNIYFEITGYNEEYVGGQLSKVENGKISRIAEVDGNVLSLQANKNIALFSTEKTQYSSSLFINTTTNSKYELDDVDPWSIIPVQDGFIYASKPGDISGTNQTNNIYLLTANGDRKPILISDENNEKLSFNINNLVYEQGNNILYWQDLDKVFSMPAGL